MNNTLQQNINALTFQKTDTYLKMQSQCCNHAIGLIKPKPEARIQEPLLGCPICQYVLEPDDAVEIVRGAGVELCRTTAKELLK